jgi:glycosyltransferase involved in cell wall biosynthesis
MRVLHLLDPAVLRPTDYRRRTLALLAELRTQGVQTVQLAGPGACGAADGQPAAGWQVYRTAAPARPPWLPPLVSNACTPALSAAALVLRLRRSTRLTRPDLIHVHAPGAQAPAWHALASLAAGCRKPLPLVAEAERRGAGRLAMPRLERWALTRAGALAAPSLEMRAALRGAGVGCRRIAVIQPASDLAGMPRRECQPPGLEGAPLIAFAGRLDRAGGIDVLLAVLVALRQRHPALRLLVAGGGSREAELDERIRASGAGGHMIITGNLSSRRVADVLPRADIAVFPALAGAFDALAPSRHLLNAMAQGCTIVASDIASHRELLVHGHNAMLFRAGSHSAVPLAGAARTQAGAGRCRCGLRRCKA